MPYFTLGLFTLLLSLLQPFALADQWRLPSPDEVSHITIEPQNENENSYYTADSLLASLPHLRRANIGKSLGFGKVWLWQRGTIHLKNGNEIRWRAFTDNIVLMETGTGPVFFTDIQSQTNDYADGKIIRIVNTASGPKEIVININDIQ